MVYRTKAHRANLDAYRAVSDAGFRLVRRYDNDGRTCWTVYAQDGREGGTVYDKEYASLEWACRAGELGDGAE